MARRPAKSKPKAKAKAKAPAIAPRSAPPSQPAWALATAAVVLGVLSLRLGINALTLVPVHFDEAQYWAYGQDLAWGYLSKPPGVGALIRVTTDLGAAMGGGDPLFWLRLASPLSHAAVAGLIGLTAARLWGWKTGFVAAVGYTAAPGVSVSAMIVSTDPPMMAAWALALYALVRAGEPGASRLWWALAGLSVGAGALAKYTALAFGVGALGYGAVSARGRDWPGTALACLVALAALSPNLLWNAANSFATLAHVAEDADPGEGYLNPGQLAEFLGAQLGVIGPLFFVAILAALWGWRQWRDDPVMRLMAWMTLGLLLPIALLAFVTRAQPNWAAPAYVAGSILAARWCLTQGWSRGFWIGQVGLGAVVSGAVLVLAVLYADRGPELPRIADPFKKMRLSEPFCTRALAAMEAEGAAVLLSDSRRRLSECMFVGTLGWHEVAVWAPEDAPATHHALVVGLEPGDARAMLLAVLGDGQEIAGAFESARRLATETVQTHSGRSFTMSLWAVQGFDGY